MSEGNQQRASFRVTTWRWSSPGWVEWALLGVGLLVLFALLPHALFGDDGTRFDDVELLLHHGELSSSPYSLVMPLASAPFLLLGELVRSPEWWAAHFNVIIATAGAIAALLLLRSRVDARVLRQSLLVLFFASLLTNRLRDYNAEVFTATLVGVGILGIVTGRRLAGWSAIVVGVVNTPAAIGGLALLAALEAGRVRRLRLLLPVAIAAALIMLEAWIRRGGPLTSGYEHDHGFRTVLPYSGRAGFSYPLLFGLLSIAFSFGRGLLFFTPGLALWLSARTRRRIRRHRRAIVLMLAFVCGLVVVYAKWWAWYGGLGWGPRFFAFAALPASVLLAVRIRDAGDSASLDALTLLTLTLSAWVGLTGAIADLTTLDFCTQHRYALESLCWYTPEYSSLGHPLVRFPSLTWKTGTVAVYCTFVFAYLASPLVESLMRRLRRLPMRPWIAGWRL